jgi:hypothetical protein
LPAVTVPPSLKAGRSFLNLPASNCLAKRAEHQKLFATGIKKKLVTSDKILLQKQGFISG